MLTNDLTPSHFFKRFCGLEGETADQLERAMERLSLSARASDRIFKMARTVADLAGQEAIGREDVAEAIQRWSLGAGPA